MPNKALDRSTGSIVLATDNPDGIRLASCPDPVCGSDVHYVKESSDGKTAHWRHSIRSDCPHSTSPTPMTPWHAAWQHRCDDYSRLEVVVTSPTGERAKADILTRDQWAIEPQHSPITGRDISRRERVHRGRVLWLFDAASPDREGEARFYLDEFQWESTAGLHRTETAAWVAVDMGSNTVAILPRGKQYLGGVLTIPRPLIKQLDYDQFTRTFINGDHTPLPAPDWEEHPRALRKVTYTVTPDGDLECRYSGTSERVNPNTLARIYERPAPALVTWPNVEVGPCATCHTPTRRYGRHGHPLCHKCLDRLETTNATR